MGKRLLHSSMLRKFYTPIQDVGVKINLVKRLLKNSHTESEMSNDDDEGMHVNLNHIGVYDEDETNDFGNVCKKTVKCKKTPEHINFKEEIEKTCQHLSAEQRGELVAVLEKHRAVFQDRPGLSLVESHKNRDLWRIRIYSKRNYILFPLSSGKKLINKSKNY